jgi:WD40 repeat protein
MAVFSNFSGEDEMTALAWSPDGTRLAEASTDRTVHIWDILIGSPPLAYCSHQGEVWALAWSPDSTYIASVSDGGMVHLWQGTTGKQVWLFHP